MKMNAAAKVIFFIQLVAVYASTSILSNALYSLSIGCLAASLIYLLWKDGLKTIRWPDKQFSWMYFPFFALIIMASILVGHHDSLSQALDFARWSLIPFALFYFVMQRRFSYSSVIIGIMAGSWTLDGSALYQWLFSAGTMRVQGYLNHPNFLAEMIEMNIPFLLVYALADQQNKRWRATAGITAFTSCIVLALTASRGGLLGLCLGGIIWCIVIFRRFPQQKHQVLFQSLVALSLILAVIAGIFFSAFQGNRGAVRSYDHERILLWESSYEMWKDHKLVGIGLRHWPKEYVTHYISPKARERNLLQPHNIYAYWFSQTGTIGGLGFLLFTVGMFVYLCRKVRENPHDIFMDAVLWAFLAIMIHSLVDSGIANKFVMRLYSAYLGIGLASSVYHKTLLPNEGKSAAKGD